MTFSPAIGIVDWIMVAIALGAVLCVVVVVAVVVVVKGRCGTAEVVEVVFAGVGTLGLAVTVGVDTFDKVFVVEGTAAGVGVLTEDWAANAANLGVATAAPNGLGVVANGGGPGNRGWPICGGPGSRAGLTPSFPVCAVTLSTSVFSDGAVGRVEWNIGLGRFSGMFRSLGW